MGVPKQKWTSEEEAALMAGVAKYGPGRWSTILKDSEFIPVLHLRSNVDLKDKWRNMNVMASGCGSRQRARPAKSKTQPIHKPDIISTDPNPKEEHATKICIPDPSRTLAASLQNGCSMMSMPRLDSLVLDAIAYLKESHGSSRAEIAKYIEENHTAPPNLEKILKSELKALIDSGNLIKVKHRYKITPNCSYSDLEKNPPPLLLEAKTGPTKIVTKADIDEELEKMRNMTPQQAAAIAVKAVVEAEAAISEAEKATKEAEAAEADAELAKVFAAAAMRALKQTALCT